jgi:hypothetical protein
MTDTSDEPIYADITEVYRVARATLISVGGSPDDYDLNTLAMGAFYSRTPVFSPSPNYGWAARPEVTSWEGSLMVAWRIRHPKGSPFPPPLPRPAEWPPPSIPEEQS